MFPRHTIGFLLVIAFFLFIPSLTHAQTYSFTQNFSLGDSHPEVREVQQFLNNHGYPVSQTEGGSPGNETTYFGQKTHQAVIKYQTDHAAQILNTRSTGTGYWGPQTRSYVNTLSQTTQTNTGNQSVISQLIAQINALKTQIDQLLIAQGKSPLFNNAVVSQFTTNLSLGDSGSDVEALQQFLKSKGHYTHPTITGYFGPITKQAVEAFQLAYADEILTPNNLSAPTGYWGPSTRKVANTQATPQQEEMLPEPADSQVDENDPSSGSGETKNTEDEGYTAVDNGGGGSSGGGGSGSNNSGGDNNNDDGDGDNNNDNNGNNNNNVVDTTPDIEAVAASAHDGNVPANTLDNDLSTRWSAEDDGQWISFDLTNKSQIGALKIAWYRGDQRTATFDIQTSDDGETWTTQKSDITSNGATLQKEIFDIPNVTARYVRIVGHGNSDNNWNSITEVEVGGFDVVDSGNQSPTASFTASPTSGTAPLEVSFDASSSNDPDGMIKSYAWNFGDNSSADIQTPSHTYSSAGVYVVGLTVTDSDDATDTITKTITVSAEDEEEENSAPEGQILTPGNGWNGSTVQPSGSGPQAIARWNVVPYQTFNNTFNVGVVAFHKNGIDRVEFAVDGGPWISASEMTENQRTGVTEYWVTLDADLFDQDGLVEVRAIAYPESGEPRVLQGEIDKNTTHTGNMALPLYANAGGSLSVPTRYVSPNGNDTNSGTQSQPMATIREAARSMQQTNGSAEGGYIYLQPGIYSWESDSDVDVNDRWLTVSSAPGVSSSQVTIVGSDQDWTNVDRLAFADLKIDSVTPQLNSGSSFNKAIWFNGVNWFNSNPTVGNRPASVDDFQDGIWATDSKFHDVANVEHSWTLIRGVTIYNIGSDAFRQPRFVVDTEVHTIGQLGINGAHEDLIQYYTGDPSTVWENVIFYGLTAVDRIRAQPFFKCGNCGKFEGVAFVNHLTAAETNTSQWGGDGDHVLFWHVTHPTNQWWLGDASLTNVSMRNSVFELVSGAEGFEEIDNNHFFSTVGDGEAWGTRVTSGGSLSSYFVNPVDDNYEPKDDSPLVGRVTDPVTPVDAEWSERNTPAAIGALSGASNSGGGNNDNEENDAGAPSTPSNLSAVAGSDSQIALSWSDVVGEDNYVLQRKKTGQAYSQVATLSANNTNYTDTDLLAGTTYIYRVKATNEAGDSSWSSTASATTDTNNGGGNGGGSQNESDSITDGLISHWAFDGDAADSTGLNDGTINGGSEFIAGQLGQSLQFNGGYVQTPLDVSSEEDITISAWIKVDSKDNRGHIIWQGESSGNGGGGEQELHLSQGRMWTGGSSDGDYLALFLTGANDSDNIQIKTTNFEANEWVHVVGTLEGINTGNITGMLWVNGVQQGSDTANNADTAAWDTNVRIGRPGRNDRTFNGTIDDVRVYDRILTSSEIQQLYNDATAYSSAASQYASILQSIKGILDGLTTTLMNY